MTLAITNVGAIYINLSEYLGWDVLNAYNTYVTQLKSIYDNRNSNPDNTSSLTPADYDTVINDIQQLADLAQNGITVTTGKDLQGNDQSFVSRINGDQGVTLDMIMRSLKAVGITPSSSTSIPDDEKVAALESWQSLGGYGVEAILQHAVQILPKQSEFVTSDGLVVQQMPPRTLQSLVEIDYVKGANDIISSQLSSLEEAQQTTKSTLDTLTIVQNIANQIQASNKQPNFVFPPNVSILYSSAAAHEVADHIGLMNFAPIGHPNSSEAYDIWKSDIAHGTNNFIPPANDTFDQFDGSYFSHVYQLTASAYFTQVFASALGDAESGRQLLTAKHSLSAELLSLEAQNPASNRNVSGTLANAVYVVIQDINKYMGALSTTSSDQNLTFGVNRWIIDTQNLPPDQGGDVTDVENHISQALQIGENLNTTQTEDVKRYLYIFEEFYKSAASILQTMSQLIEKISDSVK